MSLTQQGALGRRHPPTSPPDDPLQYYPGVGGEQLALGVWEDVPATLSGPSKVRVPRPSTASNVFLGGKAAEGAQPLSALNPVFALGGN